MNGMDVSTPMLVVYTLIMAGVTYLIRMVPLIIFRKPIKSRFIRSFLYYVPYAVLGAMTFPAILYSTGSLPSAAAGLIVSCVLAYFGRGLLTVAVSACLTVYLFDFLLTVL